MVLVIKRLIHGELRVLWKGKNKRELEVQEEGLIPGSSVATEKLCRDRVSPTLCRDKVSYVATGS